MNEEIRQRTKWFMEDRFGMFIHWGLYSIPACGEWMMSQKEMTIEEYSKYFDQFDPVDHNPQDQTDQNTYCILISLILWIMIRRNGFVWQKKQA